MIGDVAAKRTLSTKVVVLVIPPPDAVTVIGKLPADVPAVASIFSTEEQAGLQAPCEKEAVAPEGSPETEKEICWLLPESKLALMVFVTEDPALSDLSPEFVTEKLKAGISCW